MGSKEKGPFPVCCTPGLPVLCALAFSSAECETRVSIDELHSSRHPAQEKVTLNYGKKAKAG